MHSLLLASLVLASIHWFTQCTALTLVWRNLFSSLNFYGSTTILWGTHYIHTSARIGVHVLHFTHASNATTTSASLHFPVGIEGKLRSGWRRRRRGKMYEGMCAFFDSQEKIIEILTLMKCSLFSLTLVYSRHHFYGHWMRINFIIKCHEWHKHEKFNAQHLYLFAAQPVMNQKSLFHHRKQLM